MGRFFSRFKTQGSDPTNASWVNITSFYSLLIFLMVIPFVLIVALVWITGILGFSAWIFAGFLAVCAWVGWRLYRGWGRFKAKVTAQGGEFQDLMREAAKNGKDMEISLLNGLFTLRYGGAGAWPAPLPLSRHQPLALEGPATIRTNPEGTQELPPERLREELAEFLRLRDSGVISPEEFDRIKTGLLQRISA
ncbi:MAG: SHOCT domain-containing protein [Thermodesulfobacteriota bacterium]